jgi:hypothetical protein
MTDIVEATPFLQEIIVPAAAPAGISAGTEIAGAAEIKVVSAPATNPIKTARDLLAAYTKAVDSIGTAGTAAILAARDAGIALIPVMENAPKRGRQKFITLNLGSSKTIVNQCIRFANELARVQEYLDGTAVQKRSIRGLLRFLSAPSPKPKKPRKPELLTAWREASFEDHRARFAEYSVDQFCEESTPELLERLRARFADQHARLPEPDLKLAASLVKPLQDALYRVDDVDADSPLGKALCEANHILKTAGCDLFRALALPLPQPSKAKGRKAA